MASGVRDNPDHRFERRQLQLAPGESEFQASHVLVDDSRSILSRNDSPDLPFSWSVNPYRGCSHACAYCYARPGHEYLGLGAGTDFERRLVVKRRAPALLREIFESTTFRDPDAPGTRGWQGALIVFSGVTDCYQPLEHRERLTRGLLEVCLDYRNPVHVVTKGPLVERDVDVLVGLREVAGASVAISLPFLDPAMARALEPAVPPPARRLETIRFLARAGLPVTVNVSPLIPGVNDAAVPRILAAAAAAGATSAAATLLRLPGSVKEVFSQRLKEAFPLRAEKVLRRLREAHDRGDDGSRGPPDEGPLYRAEFGHRMRGEGRYAEAAFAMFGAHARRHGLRPLVDGMVTRESPASTFQRPPIPRARGPQLSLFPD